MKDDLAEGPGTVLELGGLGGEVRSIDRGEMGILDHDLRGLGVIEDIVVDFSVV